MILPGEVIGDYDTEILSFVNSLELLAVDFIGFTINFPLVCDSEVKTFIRMKSMDHFFSQFTSLLRSF